MHEKKSILNKWFILGFQKKILNKTAKKKNCPGQKRVERFLHLILSTIVIYKIKI